MDPRHKKKLEKSWAGLFYKLVRCSLVMGLKTIAHNFHQIVRFFQGDTRQKSRKNAGINQGILATI